MRNGFAGVRNTRQRDKRFLMSIVSSAIEAQLILVSGGTAGGRSSLIWAKLSSLERRERCFVFTFCRFGILIATLVVSSVKAAPIWPQSSQCISSVVVPCKWSANTKLERPSKTLRISIDKFLESWFLTVWMLIIYFPLSKKNILRQANSVSISTCRCFDSNRDRIWRRLTVYKSKVGIIFLSDLYRSLLFHSATLRE